MTNDSEQPSESVPSRAQRGPGGLFAKGNQLAKGKGNPGVARLAEAQAAVRAFGTKARVRKVLATLYDRAVNGGDQQAAVAFLRRVLGREPELSAAATVTLPALDSATGIAEALRSVVGGLATGEVERGQAAALIDALRALSESDLVQRLEAALAAAERTKGTA